MSAYMIERTEYLTLARLIAACPVPFAVFIQPGTIRIPEGKGAGMMPWTPAEVVNCLMAENAQAVSDRYATREEGHAPLTKAEVGSSMLSYGIHQMAGVARLLGQIEYQMVDAKDYNHSCAAALVVAIRDQLCKAMIVVAQQPRYLHV